METVKAKSARKIVDTNYCPDCGSKEIEADFDKVAKDEVYHCRKCGGVWSYPGWATWPVR